MAAAGGSESLPVSIGSLDAGCGTPAPFADRSQFALAALIGVDPPTRGMSAPNRNDVAPASVSVSLREEGVEVEYLDGRISFYRGVPQRVEESLTTPPGKQTHVLVTDPTETEGVLVYVNDLKTHDDILEQTGVGRVVLGEDEAEELFPGVTARRPGGRRTEIEADPAVAGGRVFVFVEDDWGEDSYEFVAAESADGTDGAPAGDDEDTDADGDDVDADGDDADTDADGDDADVEADADGETGTGGGRE